MKPICNAVKGVMGFSRGSIDSVIGLFCGRPAPVPAPEPSSSKELIEGGIASGMPDGSVIEMCLEKGFTMDQMERALQRGIEVEMEHVIGMKDTQKAAAIAKEIALDHLKEYCNYYTELDAMEQKLRNPPIQYRNEWM